jgi:hypothetical protein
VQYDQKKYPSSFEKLRDYLSGLKKTKVVYFQIDNSLSPGSEMKTASDDVYVVPGDNTYREFSGWQSGIEAVRAIGLHKEVFLLTNEAFLAPGESYLKDYASDSFVRKVRDGKKVVGRIDTFGVPISVYGDTISRWVCSNCMFLPARAVEDLGDIVSVKEEIYNFVPARYDQRHLTCSVDIGADSLKDGSFELCTDIPYAGTHQLRIEVNRFFQPSEVGTSRDKRKLSFIVADLNADDLGDAKVDLTQGWYSWPEDKWIAPRARLSITSQRAGKLFIRGWLPAKILDEIYGGRIRLRVLNDSLLFQPTAPLSDNYKELLVEWFTERWHSKFEIDSETWPLFVAKLRAILNEVLLSTRLVKLGYRLEPYGARLYY